MMNRHHCNADLTTSTISCQEVLNLMFPIKIHVIALAVQMLTQSKHRKINGEMSMKFFCQRPLEVLHIDTAGHYSLAMSRFNHLFPCNE